MGITAELRVQGQDTERTEAELGGGGQRAPRTVLIPAGGTGGTGQSCGGWGKRAPRIALILAGREKESLCWS